MTSRPTVTRKPCLFSSCLYLAYLFLFLADEYFVLDVPVIKRKHAFSCGPKQMILSKFDCADRCVWMCVCVRACVCVCARARVNVTVQACERARGRKREVKRERGRKIQCKCARALDLCVCVCVCVCV